MLLTNEHLDKLYLLRCFSGISPLQLCSSSESSIPT